MKKLATLLIAVLLLCSCNVSNNPEAEVPESSSEESSVSEVESEPEQETETEPSPPVDYEDHSDLLTVLEVTEGTRIVYEITKTGEVVEKEVPNTLYYINFKDGTPAVDHPFYHYSESCYENLVNTEPETWEHVCEIRGSYDGNYYIYYKNDEGFYEAYSTDLKHEEEMGEFIKICRADGTGLKDKEGNILLPPAYRGGIYMPFEDRIIAREGMPVAVECMRSYLFDTDMNLINKEYNAFFYLELDDGSYVGYAGCEGEFADYPCYDDNGKLCEEGYWFVDKDGNKLSEKFEYIYENITYEEKEDGTSERIYHHSFIVKKEGFEEEIIPEETYAVKD